MSQIFCRWMMYFMPSREAFACRYRAGGSRCPRTGPNRRSISSFTARMRGVLRAQGVQAANLAEVDELVRIRTWSASCYEFAHFTDEEVADGITTVHTSIDSWTGDEPVAALAYWRGEVKTSSACGAAAGTTSSSSRK
jgi:hypothetical protein